MSIFDTFASIYCVSLPESRDRREAMTNEFQRIGIEERVHWISAPRPSPTTYPPNVRKAGQFGCTMSHLKVLGNAMSANGPIVVFEDDIAFNTNAVCRLPNVLNFLSDDWDILYLGGQPVSQVLPTNMSGLFRVSDMRGSYGYAVNRRAICGLFNHITDSLMMGDSDVCGIYDYILGQFSANTKTYAMYPLVVNPAPCHSIIQDAHRDYEKLIKNRWKEFAK